MGWLGFLLSTMLLIFMSGRTRTFVRHHAPFYARWNILIVGLTIGILFGVMVHLLGRFAMPVEGGTLLIPFSTIGLISLAYIGYEPDPIDWAKKSKQTATVAAISYLIVAGALFVVDPPA